VGGGTPGVWAAAGQVDPLTGLAPLEIIRTALWETLMLGERFPLAVVVAELPSAGRPVEQPVELARRLSGRDPDLHVRAGLLARMVRDLPGTIRLEPVAGSPEVADSMLRRLSL